MQWEKSCIVTIKSYTIDIVLIASIYPMVAITKSIIQDVFADDGQALTREYIDGWLHLFGNMHTGEELAAVLGKMVEEKILLFDAQTKEYRLAA